MRTNKVHYIGQYSIPKYASQERMFSPAASKALYIIRALNEIGYRVNFISFAYSRKNKYMRARKAKLDSLNNFYLAPFLPIKRFTERFMYLWLFVYAFFNIKKHDIFLIWHTNSIRNDLINKIVKWKKMQFVYEVEEVFTLANKELNETLIANEIQSLQCPYKYVFNNITLGEKVNLRNLPQVICHGQYLPLDQLPHKTKIKHRDGKIHCIYAGIIDDVKGGAFRAIEIAKYLPKDYIIDILGFGDSQDIKKLQNRIDEINSSFDAKVIFHGKKSGDEYYSFLQQSDIALALQDMNGTFNDTSFPSKLLVYLCSSLPVVAPHIPCIYRTKISDLMNYYYKDNPQSIAKTVMEINADAEYDPITRMQLLHEDFKKDLSKLLDL